MGQGSGHGIKRFDHSKNSGNPHFGKPSQHHQRKHLKSLWSDKPDPSCHADKKERDRMAGIPEDPMAEIKKDILRMEYKDMQNEARKRVRKAWKMLDDIIDNPESSDSAKIAAFNAVHDRCFGKPATMNYNINAQAEAKPADLTEDELRRQISRLESLERTSRENEGEERPTDLRKYN